jgi:arginyl-tRNA synthetase
MNKLDIVSQALGEHLIYLFNLTPEHLKQITYHLNSDEAKASFGDINSNAALVLAKSLHRQPIKIAQAIITSFKHPLVDRIEVASPGFLNLFLTQDAFKALAQELYHQPTAFFKSEPHIPKKRYSLEFVSANPTGPLHLGHGRGGIIGDVLSNVLRFLGHTVTKEFYINDAGTQIKKLGLSLAIRCQQLLGQDIELPEDGYHGNYLIELAKQCIAEQGSHVLEKPESFFAQYAKEALLKQIKQTLATYGIHFDVWFSEKTLHDSGAITRELQELTAHGYTYEQDDALWFKSTTFGDDKDRVVRKANGELTYVAADIAYLENKIQRGFDHLIMVLGQDHHSYVTRLKGILQAMGHDPEQLDVILYQLVALKEGGEQLRMSKRAGRLIILEDIIDTVGTDVARFFYLNRKADAHLDFDIELALKKTEENPVYYIQYAYVRLLSILAKSQEHSELASINSHDTEHLTAPEYLLLKKISALKELLTTIGTTYQTHILAYYLFDLAQSFHRYYNKNRVIDLDHPKQSRARLVVVTILKNTFECVLDLLGLTKPEKM